MKPELHRYLDGELDRGALPPELAAEADEWESLLEAADLRAERAPAWLEQRVMAALPARPARPLRSRVWAWIVEPRTVRLRPLTAGAAAAAFALLLAVWPDAAPPEGVLPPEGTGGGPAEPTAAVPATVYVQFVFAAPDAESVAVAGGFNGWSTEGDLLRDTDGDGVWTGTVPLEPGVHKYMFVVDGSEWRTDPGADRYIEDGFGMRNAVIAVSTPARRRSS